MRRYDPTQPLISLHIPKTAGTSLNDVLQAWFPDGRLLPHYHQGQMPPRYSLQGGQCVHGHFNGCRDFGVWHYYPQVHQFIAFFRDPFDRFVSNWHYKNRMRQNGEAVAELEGCPSFDVYIAKCADEHRDKRFDRSLIWYLPLPPGTYSARSLFNESMVFVGVFEQMPLSLELLAASLGRQQHPLPHRNANIRQGGDFPQWRGFYERHFADEYDIYHAAQAHFERARQIYGK